MFPVPTRFIFGARLSFLWPVIKKVETKKKKQKKQGSLSTPTILQSCLTAILFMSPILTFFMKTAVRRLFSLEPAYWDISYDASHCIRSPCAPGCIHVLKNVSKYTQITPSYPWERVIICNQRIQQARVKKSEETTKKRPTTLFFLQKSGRETFVLFLLVLRFRDLCERAIFHREINTRTGYIMNEGERESCSSYLRSLYFPWIEYSKFDYGYALLLRKSSRLLKTTGRVGPGTKI